MPLNIVFLTLKIGLDENPITKALLPPSREGAVERGVKSTLKEAHKP